jgi:hypothetical protein
VANDKGQKMEIREMTATNSIGQQMWVNFFQQLYKADTDNHTNNIPETTLDTNMEIDSEEVKDAVQKLRNRQSPRNDTK